ncbi:potassium voltage-gated channel subfamily H member 4, partial [Tyto alba]|uniref:potassium voltage-gated channel subfamily H member 4 n=1 Tax=Tyto alba TaxID=56313 RepID=UPI001C67BB67
MPSPAGTGAGGTALAMETEEIKQNIRRLNQEINQLNQEVSQLSRELQRMMELLQGPPGAPQPPAYPCRLPAAASPPPRPPVPVPPCSGSSPSTSPRAKCCPVRSRSARAAASPAMHPWVGTGGPCSLRGDTPSPDPRPASDSQPLSLPPRSARTFPGCSAGGQPCAPPQPRT